MPLTPAEKQRRYRERRKNNPEKDAESKRKDRERYHCKQTLTGHGKGAADGIDGFLKRTADQLVAHGRDICDATNFCFALKDVSKVRLHLIINENIEQSSNLIPENIVPLVDSDDDAPLISLKEKPSSTHLSEQPSTSKQNDDALIEKENIHANKIKLERWSSWSRVSLDGSGGVSGAFVPTPVVGAPETAAAILTFMADAYQLLIEAYNEAVLNERSCLKWFQKFKNGDFDIEGKEYNGRPKIYEDAELEEDSSQTQKKLSLTLGVTQQAVSHRLKSLRMIHKQGHWVPYQLKPRDVECRLCMSEMLPAMHKKKFLH
ncbi:Mariner Mos1 transposase [Eumeta japonica]|uniref:Mariner Mos1 transposase n=1 Tax=Eumeta variegata TaxID=151549 RepID=A0A4C1ZYL3_EUMVA|nr:Mariner Mos1 transposase [Eumeta japonica]